MLVLGGIRGATRLFRERYYPMSRPGGRSGSWIVGANRGRRGPGPRDPPPAPPGHAGRRLPRPRPATSRPDDLAGIKVLGSPEDVAACRPAGIETVLVPTPRSSPAEVRALVDRVHRGRREGPGRPGVRCAAERQAEGPSPATSTSTTCSAASRSGSTTQSIGRFLRGRVVLVTGAAGSIGSEICRQVLAFRPARLVLLDHAENGLFYIERELRARPPGRDRGRRLRRRHHRRAAGSAPCSRGTGPRWSSTRPPTSTCR